MGIARVLTLAAIALAAPARAQDANPPTAPRPPDDYDRLGRLEREEVDAVLAERGLRVDRAPAGKRIRRIVVVSRPVFAQRDGFLTFFNIFHVTTRESAVAQELLFEPGEIWNPTRVDESMRTLRDPRFHNVIVILPLVADEEAAVDVLVVARDVWSLRLNSRYEVVGSTITSLSLSLSENNLAGLRKRGALAFSMDQGAVMFGPTYYDPNLVGTRLTLDTGARLIVARDGSGVEGTRSATILAYPFRSLLQHWGGSLEVTHNIAVARSFVGTELRTYDAPETPAVEMLPWRYHDRQLATEAQLTRSFGEAWVQRVGGGHELSLVRPALADDFPDDPALRAAFTRDVLPRSERASSLFARWQLFTPIYAALRDLATFDFREDYQLGPTIEARASQALRLLGSEDDFSKFQLTARLASGWGGGLYRAGGGAAVRLQDGRFIDRTYTAFGYAASPRLVRLGRLVAAVDLDILDHEEGNRFFVLGGSNGLRGYEINELSGQARLLGHLEARTRPLRLGFYRLGAVAFWDAGDAAPTVADLRLKHAVGAGLRSLIPQLDPLVIRLDWAVALNGASRGLPGRFSLGVEQVF